MGYTLILFLGIIVILVGAVLFVRRALFGRGEKIIVYSSGKLVWRGEEYKCAIGKGGVTENKKEGDGATPLGCFPVREVYYRPDRMGKPETNIPINALSEEDGWCDDQEDAEYNKPVKLPYEASHEKLWREDEVYDIIVVLGYNDAPPVPGEGSAIFMHVARPNYSPTAGCVALSLEDLKKLLSEVGENVRVCVKE